MSIIFPSPFAIGTEIAWAAILGASMLIIVKIIHRIAFAHASNRVSFEVAKEQFPYVPDKLKELRVSSPVEFCAVVYGCLHIKLLRPFLDPQNGEYLYIEYMTDKDGALYEKLGYSDLFFDMFGRRPYLQRGYVNKIARYTVHGGDKYDRTVDLLPGKMSWESCFHGELEHIFGKPISEITWKQITSVLSPEIVKFLEGVIVL